MSSKDEAEKYQRDGFLVIEDFATDGEVDSMIAECAALVDAMNPEEHKTIFSATKQSFRDEYFINSADKLGYFYEDGALDEQGHLAVDKSRSLNKIGHAMHVLCPSFRKFTFSDKVKNVLKNLDFVDPVVPQSMYIFKQPGIGGEVVPHQDATYLYGTPLRLVGLWLALEDATLDNGCMWFSPGSHQAGIYGDYRMVRNPESGGPSCIYTGEKPTYDDCKFISTPVKKGSLVLIHGLVVHKSARNTSENSRHIYTFHIYDAASSQWSDKNWLQPTEAQTFTHMNDVQL